MITNHHLITNWSILEFTKTKSVKKNAEALKIGTMNWNSFQHILENFRLGYQPNHENKIKRYRDRILCDESELVTRWRCWYIVDNDVLLDFFKQNFTPTLVDGEIDISLCVCVCVLKFWRPTPKMNTLRGGKVVIQTEGWSLEMDSVPLCFHWINYRKGGLFTSVRGREGVPYSWLIHKKRIEHLIPPALVQQHWKNKTCFYFPFHCYTVYFNQLFHLRVYQPVLRIVDSILSIFCTWLRGFC